MKGLLKLFLLMTGGLIFSLAAPAVYAVDVSGEGEAAVQKTEAQPGTPGVSGAAGATVTQEPGGLTITGISSAVGTVDTRTVSGDASGTLRIQWGTSDSLTRGSGGSSFGDSRTRGGSQLVLTPPGAPELPADLMFGSGFMILGLGLLLTRRLW